MSLVATVTVCLITRDAPSAVSGEGGPRGEGGDWSGSLLGDPPGPHLIHYTITPHYITHHTIVSLPGAQHTDDAVTSDQTPSSPMVSIHIISGQD